VDNEFSGKIRQRNIIGFGFLTKVLNGILFSILELVFLLFITFISFSAVVEPYERIKTERDSKGQKHHYLSDLIKRIAAYFFLGLPFIYLGLKISNLTPISISLDVNNLYQLILTIIITIAKVPNKFYILIFIPTIIIIVLKFYTEKAWHELNKESEKLLNIRLETFRDKKSLHRIYEESKKSKSREFRKFVLDYIKKSPMSFVLFGFIFLQIFLTIISFAFGRSFEFIIIYLVPLGAAWALISLFLTIFEGQISKLAQAFIETKKLRQM